MSDVISFVGGVGFTLLVMLVIRWLRVEHELRSAARGTLTGWLSSAEEEEKRAHADRQSAEAEWTREKVRQERQKNQAGDTTAKDSE